MSGSSRSGGLRRGLVAPALFSSSRRGLSVSILPALQEDVGAGSDGAEDERVPDLVRLSGSRLDLLFLSQVLKEMAMGATDSYQIEPHGVGSVFFSPASPLGLYIEVLGEDDGVARSVTPP